MNPSIQQIKDSPLKANGRFGRLSFIAWNFLVPFFLTICSYALLAAIYLFNLAEENAAISIIFLS